MKNDDTVKKLRTQLAYEQERSVQLEIALTRIYCHYQSLAVRKIREPHEDSWTDLVLRRDLSTNFAICLEALKWDSIKFETRIARVRADRKSMVAHRVFNWKGDALLRGYEKQSAEWVKKGLLKKKAADALVEDFKRKYEQNEQRDDEARCFDDSIRIFGEEEVREICGVLGLDFCAMMENLERYRRAHDFEKTELAGTTTASGLQQGDC